MARRNPLRGSLWPFVAACIVCAANVAMIMPLQVAAPTTTSLAPSVTVAPGGDLDLWRWAVTQGGLTVALVLMILIYFKRTGDTITTLTALVKENTASQTAAASTNLAVQASVDRLSIALNRQADLSEIGGRRRTDSP